MENIYKQTLTYAMTKSVKVEMAMFEHLFIGRPGRKKPISGVTMVVIVFLLILICGVFFYSLHMAASGKVLVFSLDDYASFQVEGADGYGMTVTDFEYEDFQKDFEEFLKNSGTELEPGKISELAESASAAILFDVDIEPGERAGRSPEAEEQEALPQEDDILPPPGIYNGDVVTFYVSISKELQKSLMEYGLAIAFDFEPVTITAEGLLEAEPYDLFADLAVSYEGFDGAGQAILTYQGYFPITFSADPQTGLANGDTFKVKASLSEEYDLNRLVEEYTIMPMALEKTYTVTGLWVKPVSIGSFTEETIDWLRIQSRDAVSSLLEEEYTEGERIDALDDDDLYFCSADTEENVDNRLYCLFLVHYISTGGDEVDYYYYVRYDNLILDDSGNVISDLTVAEYPQKPSVPLGEMFGSGEEVSVPGFLNFRTLAGFETKEQLYDRVIRPLSDTYEISSIEQ